MNGIFQTELNLVKCKVDTIWIANSIAVTELKSNLQINRIDFRQHLIFTFQKEFKRRSIIFLRSIKHNFNFFSIVKIKLYKTLY